MADRVQVLLELERRGKLPARYVPVIAELRRRGSIPGAQQQLDVGEFTSPERRAELAAQGQQAAEQGGVPLGMAGMEESTARMIREAPASTQMRANLITALNSPTALMGYGLKQALGRPLTREEEEEVRVRRGLRAAPGGQLANISGNILAAAPAAAAGETALAGAAPGAIRSAMAAGVVGAAGGAVQPTLGEESRAANIGLGTMLGGGLSLAGSAGGRVLTGALRPTPEGSELIRQGVPITPGQGAASETVRGIESVLEGVPYIGAARRRAEDEVIRRVTQEAIPPGQALPDPEMTPNTMDSGSFFRSLDDLFDKAYRDTLGGLSIPIKRFKDNLEQRFSSYGHRMSPRFRAMLDQMGNKATGAEFNQLKSELQNLKSTMRRSPRPSDQNFADFLDQAVDALKNRLPPERRAALQEVDKAFSNRKTLGRAVTATAAAREAGRVTPSQMLTSVKQRTPTTLFEQGRGMGQGVLDPASRAMTTTKGSDVWRALRQAGKIVGTVPMVAAAPFYTPGGARAILGGTRPQQLLAEWLRRGQRGTASALGFGLQSSEE